MIAGRPVPDPQRQVARGGNALRAAVLGANDGLVSNLSLVMGVAGAVGGERTILLAGLAGLVAGACSMAMGEWVSVTSSRELYQRQIGLEVRALAEAPDGGRHTLALIYEARGLRKRDAEQVAARLLADKAQDADTLAREALGIDSDQLGGSAWQAALASFLLFSAGAIVPVLSFFFLTGRAALLSALLMSGAALVSVGAATSLFTGRRILPVALRQMLIGYAAAGITYGIGRLMGLQL